MWSAKEKKLVGLNGSGRSPPASTWRPCAARSMARSTARPLVRQRARLRGRLVHAARTLPVPCQWNSCTTPTIEAAYEGRPVPQTIAYYLERSARVLAKYPGFAETWMPGGHTPLEGERFANRA
ncbi:MAG: gamma-glutamyltransferase [Planctomycetota bacterium]